MPLIRPATSDDGPFLQQMLAVAADWRRGSVVRSIDEIMGTPELAHYIDGWPRDRDVGVVAENRSAVGAAWWRFFSTDDPGYGFVGEGTPELSIGVVASARGRGVGTMLLEALIQEADRLNLRTLSLSVERDNPAEGLYRRAGFVAVGEVGGSRTMTLSLGE